MASQKHEDRLAHILLAEDDASMRQFLCMALESAGHKVTSKEDGLSALAALEEHTDFDLLLTDVVMPGMDGIELAQLAVKKNKDIKIMYITGFAAVALGQKSPQPANARVVSKPFHLNELVSEVDALLQKA